MTPSPKWVYWVGLIVAGSLLCEGGWLYLLNQPSGWQFAWTAPAIVPIAAVILYVARLFAPRQIQGLIGRLTHWQKFALYWLHYLAIIGFLAAGIALLCLNFAPGHRGRYLLQWLWIDFLVLAICLADLSGRTGNIWHPQKPA